MSPTQTADYDLVICGGAMTGATLACALQEQPLRIAIIEASEPSQHSGFDERYIALNHHSLNLLGKICPQLSLEPFSSPIRQIHISDRTHHGITHLHHNDFQLTEFGRVTPLKAVGQQLLNSLKDGPVHWLSPDRLTAINQEEQLLTLTLQSGQKVTTRLLIGADGSQSAVRQLQNLPTEQRDYGQSAIITTITSDKAHHFTAYERFTPDGPLALLPVDNHRYSVVWCVKRGEVESLLALEDQPFIDRLQKAFGYRAGQFIDTDRRHHYPLVSHFVPSPISHRTVLIGNAAQQLHPVAGQGFNLGLRDLAALSQILTDDCANNTAPGGYNQLRRYQQQRAQDRVTTKMLTDSLLRLFISSNMAVSRSRNIGLTTLEHCKTLKAAIAWRAMGY